MIDLIFYFGTEIVFIRIEGTNIRFANSNQGNQWATIDGLKFDYQGVVKEYPDLKDKQDWKDESLRRFKEKIKAMTKEEQICEYIVEDLKMHGYTPKFKQKAGFRREILK
jgi:hypothetical protein